MSVEIKHRSIALERMCALETILLTCNEGDKSEATVTPRSRHELTTDKNVPSIEIETSVTF